jgi:hypothetical protein
MDMGLWSRDHAGGIRDLSWRGDHGGGVTAEASGTGIVEDESWRRMSGEIMEKKSRRKNHAAGFVEDS